MRETWLDVSSSLPSAPGECPTGATVRGSPGDVQHLSARMTYFQVPVPAQTLPWPEEGQAGVKEQLVPGRDPLPTTSKTALVKWGWVGPLTSGRLGIS